MTLTQAQQALAQLFMGGAFHFNSEQSTIDHDTYKKIIAQIEPINYEFAYNVESSRGTINFIEKLIIDRDTAGNAEMFRKETTWNRDGLTAFELELTTLPKLILVENQPRDTGSILTTVWWVDKDGDVLAYEQTMNGLVLTRLGMD